jgi:predicted nucleic acid-binding protein
MIVIDASLAVEILLPTPLGSQLRDSIFREERHAPHLVDIEFASALGRLRRASLVDENEASRAIQIMQSWTLVRHQHRDLLARVWALRESISPYDAAYVSLAEALRAPLLTCDAKLARSHGHAAEIILLQ